MTVADATPDLEKIDRHDRAFLGHPKGLGYLGFTEACERFSYYSMQTLLVLYMVNYLLVPGRMQKVIGLEWLQAHVYGGLEGQRLASAIFGTYTALVYFTPIFGGILADRVLGRTNTLILGGLLMALRHFLMVIESAFVFALFALLLGVGAFKGNIATPGGRALRPERPSARHGVPDLLHLHQHQRDRRSAGLRNARPEGRLALRVRLRRRSDGARPHHLPDRTPLAAGR